MISNCRRLSLNEFHGRTYRSRSGASAVIDVGVLCHSRPDRVFLAVRNSLWRDWRLPRFRVGRYQARFSGVVFPGETIVTSMWREGDKLLLSAAAKERGAPVITNAALTIKE